VKKLSQDPLGANPAVALTVNRLVAFAARLRRTPGVVGRIAPERRAKDREGGAALGEHEVAAESLLNRFVAGVPGVAEAFVVGADGLPIASSAGVDPPGPTLSLRSPPTYTDSHPGRPNSGLRADPASW
jgi:hypothetical protein